MPNEPPLLTLTTDFGLVDEYVGVMKGVILARAPRATIVDLCHHVPPQDIRHGALLLHAARRYFPAGALHVAVVDPGVGSSRRIVLLCTESAIFLAPDNGLLTPILQEPGLQKAYAVDNAELFLHPISRTFHGRDIFAPVAAALMNGLTPDAAGPAIDPELLQRIHFPLPLIDETALTISGEIIAVDHFGNLVSNITSSHLAALGIPPRRLEVCCNAQPLGYIRHTYSEGKPGEPLALIGSRGTVEIAARNANAAVLLRASIGARVELSPAGEA